MIPSNKISKQSYGTQCRHFSMFKSLTWVAHSCHTSPNPMVLWDGYVDKLTPHKGNLCKLFSVHMLCRAHWSKEYKRMKILNNIHIKCSVKYISEAFSYLPGFKPYQKKRPLAVVYGRNPWLIVHQIFVSYTTYKFRTCILCACFTHKFNTVFIQQNVGTTSIIASGTWTLGDLK